MAEPPPPPFPQRMPLLSLPLPQANSSPPKVPEPLPTPKVSVAAARLPTAPPPAAALPQAEPPPRPVAALPQPRPPSPPFAALPQPPSPPVALPSSPRDHVARNPRSGDVESGSGMSTPTVEALQEITLYVGAAAPVPQISKLHEEDGVADERDSTSLSDICARMIQSCTYTVEVKVCGGGTENSEDSTFSWDIVEGSSSSLNDLLASIAGTFPLFSGESIMIEYVDSIGGKNICVSNDEECLKMYESFHQNRGGNLIIKQSDPSDSVDVHFIPLNQTPSITLPSQTSDVNDEAIDTYLANPHEEYEHVGVDEEDQYSIDSAGSDSDDELGEKKDIPSEHVEDSSDDEEWVTEDARPDVTPEIVYDKENPPMHVGAKYSNIEEFRLAIATYAIKKEFDFKVEKSEPTRFRAYCRESKDCTWRIHVGRLDDGETMEVYVLANCILPSVMNELNEKSRGLDIEYERIDDMIAEVSESAALGGKRHITDLANRTCTCRAFQVSGKPCKHAISFITGIRGVTIADFVDDYYSVAKFTAAYAHVLPGLTDMSQWPSVNKDFILNPPILRRAPGRPKVQRHKSGAENSKSKGNKGQHQCPICKAYGHRWQSCKDAAPEALTAYAEVAKQKRDKRKKKPSTKAILPCSIETENTLPLLPSPSYAIEDNVAKSKSSKTSSKSTRSKAISVAPDSPAMGTRSKKSVSPNSPAMSTRSKKRVVPNSQVMATRSKKKLKL